MILLRRCVLFAVLIACSGCIPMYLRETPHMAGVVLDAQTGQPIFNARLHYERLPIRRGEQYPKGEVQTSADGRFDFPAIWRLRLIPLLPFEDFSSEWLIAEADGYDRAQRCIRGPEALTNETFILQRRWQAPHQ